MSKSFTIEIALPTGMTPLRYRKELQAQLAGEAKLSIVAARPILGFDGTSIIIEVVVELVVAVTERVFRKRLAKAMDSLARRLRRGSPRALKAPRTERKRRVKTAPKRVRPRNKR